MKRFASLPVAGVVFFLILVSSWLLFCFLPLGQNRKEALFLKPGWEKKASRKRRINDLQDKLQEEY